MLTRGQQGAQGVKLRAVAQVLLHGRHLRQDAARLTEKTHTHVFMGHTTLTDLRHGVCVFMAHTTLTDLRHGVCVLLNPMQNFVGV